MRFLLVDGYNIIHAWPRLASLREQKLEYARDGLVASLRPLADMGGYKVVVVFDAAAVNRQGLEAEGEGGLEVIFTRRGQTADSLIEELARRLAGENEVSVATGDRAEGDTAWSSGAAIWSADRLAREVESVQEDIAEESRRLKDKGRPPRLQDRVSEAERRALDRRRFT